MRKGKLQWEQRFLTLNIKYIFDSLCSCQQNDYESTEILAIGWQKINEAKNLPMERKTKQNKASTEKKKDI